MNNKKINFSEKYIYDRKKSFKKLVFSRSISRRNGSETLQNTLISSPSPLPKKFEYCKLYFLAPYPPPALVEKRLKKSPYVCFLHTPSAQSSFFCQVHEISLIVHYSLPQTLNCSSQGIN